MSFEHKILQINGENIDESTIGRQIKRQSTIHPDEIAMVRAGFEPISYRSLQRIIDGVRADLRLAGFDRNSRIAIALPNGPHAAVAIIAISSSAVAIPLNPTQTQTEIAARFKSLQPNAVLLMDGIDSAVRRAAEFESVPIIDCTPASPRGFGLKLTTKMRTTECAVSTDEPGPDAAAFIFQTSGTSAEPKSIPFSHRNMLAAAARLHAWFELTPHDRCLSVSPLYYSHGLKVTIFTPLLTGGSVAFPTDPSKFDQRQWFGDLKPTWYSAGPTLHRLVWDRLKASSDAKRSHSLRFVLSGGAPLPQDVQEGLQQALDVPVVEHYGSSEAAQIAANLPKPGCSKPGTCGTPWPGVLTIVGENGEALSRGELGEILVRGPTVMSGYIDAPQLNRAAFVDGWLKTGDIGSLDDEGFLTLHGRKNDVINRGGEKIWPDEVDGALARHPSVSEAAAFSVPHARLGEDVAAAITIKPGTAVSLSDLRNYLSKTLAPYKIPRHILIVDQLPKGLTGKVLRRQLRQDFKSTDNAPTIQPHCDSDGLPSQLIRMWERLLNYTSIGIDDDFFAIGGDSLLAVEMVCEIEQLIGRAIPTSILFEASTIRQLTDKLTEEPDQQSNSIVPIFSNGDQRPFFYIHGDPGGGNYVKRLAELLGPNQPILAIAPHGTDHRPIRGSIEEMAEDNLALVRDKQPHGPYRLGGYCTSGLVAFEVARLLVAAGEKIEMVVMVDPPTFNAYSCVQGFFAFLNLDRAKERHFRELGGFALVLRLKNHKAFEPPPVTSVGEVLRQSIIRRFCPQSSVCGRVAQRSNQKYKCCLGNLQSLAFWPPLLEILNRDVSLLSKASPGGARHLFRRGTQRGKVAPYQPKHRSDKVVRRSPRCAKRPHGFCQTFAASFAITAKIANLPVPKLLLTIVRNGAR